MKKLVIDASVAVKWVVTESGTPEALRLLDALPLIAPDLLMAECANILWKKVQRKELSEEEAVMASRILQRADIEISPMRQLLERATRLAIELDHPAYDCVYLALALENGWQFVTADDRFLRKLRQGDFAVYNKSVASMGEALDGLRGSNG